MLLMFEKGIRGGITQAVKRYAKANNKYMPDYDSDEASAFLQYLDANNLYKNHEVYTVNKCKIALNRDDDKRIIREDGITTLAGGFLVE